MAAEVITVKLVLEEANFYASLGKANKALDDFGSQTTGATKSAGGGFESFDKIATGALMHIGALTVDVATKAAGAIGGFAQDSIKAAGDFQGGMNEFTAAAGGSMEAAGLSTQQFSDLFIQLGKDLPVSTAEVQKAAIALVKGGLDPAVIAGGGLRDSLNFAAGAGMDLEKAAELGVKMLGTFTSVTDSAATKTKFLGSAQDLLVKAANASTLNVEQLGDAMLAAGGQARAVGLNYQDFVTSMGLISPAFGSAAEAGTSFKNFLVRLQPTTKPATEAMASLGLYTAETGSAFYDAQGKFIGVEKASQLLQDSLSGLSDAQRVQALQAIFGNDAMGAAAALADGGSKAYQTFAAQMASANGVTAQAAAVNQGLNFEMTNFQGTVEAVQIAVGTMLTPGLEKLYQGVLTPAIGVVLSFVQALQGNQEAFASLAPPLQGLIGWLQQGYAAFQQITTVVSSGGLSGALDMIKPTLAGVGGILTALLVPALASATVAFGAAVVAVAPVIAVLGLAGAASVALYQAWQQNIGGVQQTTQAALSAVWAVIQQVVGMVTAFWQQNGAAILADAQRIWRQVQTVVSTAVNLVMTVVSTVFGWVSGFIQQHGETIMSVVRFAWDLISGIISGRLDMIQTVIGAVLKIVQGDFSGASTDIVSKITDMGAKMLGWAQEQLPIWGAKLKDFATAAWQWVQDATPPLLVKLADLGGQLITWVQRQLPTWTSKLKDFATAAWQWVAAAAPPLLQALAQYGGQLISYIGQQLPGWISTLLRFGTAAVTWIGTAIPPLLVEAGKFIGSLMQWLIGTAVPQLVSWGVQAATALLGWVQNSLIPGIAPAFAQFSAAVVRALANLIGGTAQAAANVGTGIAQGIANGINGFVGRLADAARHAALGALDAIKRVLGIASPSVVFALQVGEPISQGIAKGIDAAADAPQKAVQGMAGDLATQWTAKLKDFATPAWQWVQQATPPLLQALAQYGGQLISYIGQQLPIWGAKLKDFATAAWQWVAAAAPPLLQALAQYGGQLISYIGQQLPGWISTLLRFGTAAVTWIGTAIPPLLVEAGKFIGSLMQWLIGTAVPQLVSWGVQAATALLGWVQNSLIPGIAPAFAQFSAAVVRALANLIGGTAQAANQIGTGIAKGLADGIIRGLQDAWSGVQNIFSGLVSGLTGSAAASATPPAAPIPHYIWVRMGTHIGESGWPATVDAWNAIPHLASGGRNLPGGLSLVGERGPELVNVPRGSNVYGAGMTSSLVRPPAAAPSGGGVSNSSVSNNWSYAPQYNSAPPNPSQDFAAMRVLAGAG